MQRSIEMVRPSGRRDDVVQFELALVDFFLDAAGILGFPKSVAAIYGICFSSPDPLSFSEIYERLDLSSGSVSQGLRILREAGALKLVTTAASDSAGKETAETKRNVRYTPDLELRGWVVQWIEKRLQKQLTSGRQSLIAILNAIPEAEGDALNVLQQRIDTLKAWHDKANALLPVAKTFLKLT